MTANPSGRTPTTISAPLAGRSFADREAGTAAQPDLAGPRESALEEVHLGRADEARDEQVGRAPVELLGRAHLLDDALVHDHDPVGERHGLDLVVGDVDHGGAQLLVQPRDLEPDGRAQGGVEVGERLVEQEHLGVAHDRPADRHPLPLAAGKLRRLALQEALQGQDARRLLGPLGDQGRGLARLLQAQGPVPGDVEMRVEGVALEHHGDAAPGRRQVVDHLPADADRPKVCVSSPAMMRRSVDLPQPEAPSRTMNSPSAMSRSTPLSTSVLPKDLRIWSILSWAMGAVPT